MAVSVAVKWSPTPSSPLFDEGSSGTTRSSTDTGASTSTVTPSNNSSRQRAASNNSGAAPNSEASSRAFPSSLQPPGRSLITSPQPRSYASVLDSGSRSPNSTAQNLPLQPQQSFSSSSPTGQQQSRGAPMFGSQFQQQPFGQSTPGYFTQAPSQQNQFAWAQYQQMLQAQAQHFYNQAAASDAAMAQESRHRTSSTPQRPQPITYNDTFRQQQQSFPGVSFANNAPQMQMRAYPGPGANPGGTAQGHVPSHSVSSSVSSSGGYHPYRRTQRGNSDVGLPSNGIQFGQLPSVGQMNAPLPSPSTPGSLPRARTSSTTSAGSARDTSPMLAPERKKGIPPVANPPTQAGLSHLRGAPPRSNSASSFSSDISSRAGTSSDLGSKAASNVSSNANQHGRTESSSSIGSASGARPAASTTAAAAVAKKPSPLSKQSAQRDDDDDDSGAVYGGSDDERVGGGRSTPMPAAAPKGEKSKKTGLSGKLRKVLSFSNMNDIQQADPNRGDRSASATFAPGRPDLGGRPNSSGDTNGSTGSTRSTSPPRTPDNGVNPMSSAASISSRRSVRPPLSNTNEGKRSIFNRKFNSSTDNISISSTVSSASVMLRKVGNLGKLARRHSLMGLTNMFNKDKEREGREDMHDDDFGAPPTTTDDSAIGGSSKGKKLKSKKGTPATASITHATVELESSRAGENGMTPAASYVRQHQIQMQQQAEAEAKAARERADAEAKAKAKASEEVAESRQKMIEKEKERLKSKRGWRKKFGVGGSGSVSSESPTGLETTYAEPGGADDSEVPPYGGYAPEEGPSVSALPPQINVQYDGTGFDASFDDELLGPPQMPAVVTAAAEESGDEYETDSLRHWGEGIERSRASAATFKDPKSILKKTTSFDQLPSFDKPFAGRIRANSYDAPQGAAAQSALSNPPMMSQMSNTTAGVERLDGVARTDSLLPSRPSSKGGDTPRSASPSPGVLGHHSNSSMPTLSLMVDLSLDSQPLTQRTVTGPPQPRKRLMFAEEHLYHSTWPAHVYDRRGELATCNRLTPVLAQRIKEELNTYKMEEMAVAASSRIYTHFFV